MPALSSSADTVVNSNTTGGQFYGDAAPLADGGWAVMWLSDTGNFVYRVALQRFEADGRPVGGETLVSGGAQGQPQMVGLTGGGFVVAWTSAGSNNTADIYAQRFDASGAAVGSTFMVNQGEYRDQRLLELTPLTTGGFVAFFSQPQQDAPTSSPGHNPNAPPSTFALMAQAFDASGAKVGGYVQVAAPTPQIPAMDVEPWPGGGYIIVTQGYDPATGNGYASGRVMAQVYAPDGSAVSPKMALAQGWDPQVEVLANGDFVIAYRTLTNDNGDVGVQRYSALGEPIGSEQIVQSDRYTQVKPQIEALPDGGYLVAYYSNAELAGAETFDDGAFRLYVQRFGADGVPVGGPMQMSDGTISTSLLTEIAVQADGDALALWTRRDPTTNLDVIGRLIPDNAVGASAPNTGVQLQSSWANESLAGGAANDTLTAGRGGDTLTGGAGADRFVLSTRPWSPIEITDFAVGSDSLDLRALFREANLNTGVAEHLGYIRLEDDGAGGVKVLFDRDGSAGTAQQYPDYVAHLRGVWAQGLSWTQLANGAPADQGEIVMGGTSSPTPSEGGQVITSPGPGSTLTGTAGNDTIYASQGQDVITTGAGADVVAYRALPWNAGRITDFVVGTDKLDLSEIFQSAGCSGSDPVADGRMRFDSDGAGGTRVYFDRDAPNGGDWPFLITTLENVSPVGLTWAQLSGGGSQPPPSSGGQVLTAQEPNATLTGGAGNDTLNASQGYDVLTGNGGADHFVFANENWAPATITDFQPGQDRIDYRGVFDDWGYAGTDPFADGRIILTARGSDTIVELDNDGPGGEWPNYVLTLQGVAPSQLSAGDWIFR